MMLVLYQDKHFLQMYSALSTFNSKQTITYYVANKNYYIVNDMLSSYGTYWLW